MIANLAREERYVVVYRWAGLGTGGDNEIRVVDSALDHQHLRIVRIGGQLWMESAVKENSLVVEGVTVGPGGTFPLTPGLTLRCGELEGTVDEFRQFGL